MARVATLARVAKMAGVAKSAEKCKTAKNAIMPKNCKNANSAKVVKIAKIAEIAKIAGTEIVSCVEAFKIWVFFGKIDGLFGKKSLIFFKIAKRGEFFAESVSNGFISQKCLPP